MKALKVLETNIIHASDVIYWLDGSTSYHDDMMERLNHPVNVELIEHPADLQMLQGNGKTAFWRKFSGIMVEGVADDGDKAFPPTLPFTLAGSVFDPQGRYNPRLFNITAGTAIGHRIILYPTPLGTRFSKSGGIRGTLRWIDNESAVPWALLTLEVEIALETFMIFRAQADFHGDFLMPLKGLPPIPEGIGHYDAELTISVPIAEANGAPLDPTDLSASSLGSLDIEDTFEDRLALQIVFGENRRLQTFNKRFLAVKPS